MGVFVTQNTPLPALKRDLNPPQGLPTELDAADINNLWSALGDVRAHTLGWANVVEYGAKGDGITDDSAAFAAALATGKNVRGSSGDTYLVNGGLAATTAGQVIDMSGATVKLKDTAANTGILSLGGVGSKVVGGTWDMNATANTGTVGSAQYFYYAVLLNADSTVADGLFVKNSFGIGIKANDAVNYVVIRNNRIEAVQFTGIYIDGSSTTDAVGNQIVRNKVDVSGTASARGIYIASASPYTFVQRRWRIQDNEVVGPLVNATGAAVGITGRGADGIISGNHVYGFDIGVSPDIASGTLIENNRIEGANGPDAFGIEAGGLPSGGNNNVVSANYVKGGKRGITGSATSTDGLLIIGNQLIEQTVNAIYFQPSGASPHAQRLNISNNTVFATLTALNGAIRLYGDCRFSKIEGNVIKGPGSASAGGRAIFFDQANSDQLISGNRLAGWERAVALYNPAAVPQTNIEFIGNDVSEDIAGGNAAFLNLEGLATYGAGIVQMWNTGQQGTASNVATNYFDRATALSWGVGNALTPEGSVTAGVGSLYTKTIASGGPVALFQKVSGTGNTGWRPVYTAGLSTVTWLASMSIDASLGDYFIVNAASASNVTINNPTNAGAGAPITVAYKNVSGGVLGTLTWGTAYKLAAWTQPANGFSRSITFRYDGTNWIEETRTPADVPN